METTLLYFGLAAIIISILLILSFTKAIKNNGILTSKFRAIKSIDKGLHTSLNDVKQALDNAGFKKVKFYRAENWFKAQSKLSSSQFSDEIVVRVRGNDEMTVIYFYSVCSLGARLGSWGKNKKNYKSFERELEKLNLG